MITSTEALANNSFVSNALANKTEAKTNTDTDSSAVKSRYLSNKTVQSSGQSTTTLEDGTVNISTDALRLLQSDKLDESKAKPSVKESSSDLLEELIEKTKEKIDKVAKELDKIVGNGESVKQHRKALQSQLLLLHNQLLLLVNQKAEMLAKK